MTGEIVKKEGLRGRETDNNYGREIIIMVNEDPMVWISRL